MKADYDADGNVVAWWADWNDSNVTPTPAYVEPSSSITAKITCSGKPQIKVGGSAKTIAVGFYDESGEELPGYTVPGWSYSIDGIPLSNNYISITPIESQENKFKLRFLGDDSYIGKVLKLEFETGEITASLDLEILPL